jgi:hypothetical protein
MHLPLPAHLLHSAQLVLARLQLLLRLELG